DEGDESWDKLNSHFFTTPALNLRLEGENRTGPGYSPDDLSFLLDAETTAKIDHICSAHDVSSEVFLFACWQILVWHLTDSKDFAIDYLCESKRIGGLREALGAFARFCPAHSHVEPDYRFIEMLEMVDQSIRSANERLNPILRRDSGVIENGHLAGRANAIGF